MIDHAFRVLVVDDSRLMQVKLAKATELLGHVTDAAANGQEAIAKLCKSKFDLVLLDIEMPVMDGFEVLTQMQAMPALKDIPVIVISAIEEMDSIVRAIELGAVDFLPKHFEKVLFTARVNACLDRKRMSDQRADHLDQIQAEKTKVDGFLSATLPIAAITELKATNQVKPRRFENVVVLFADVVSFTSFCDNNPAEEAVFRLQSLINGFEEICIDEGLEKIKTIGDAFMATAGLLNHLPRPEQSAASCALRMVAAAPELAKGWQVRVGIHTGAVIAGVIGQQHHYDLWGDTVNTAARITGIADPSSVCTSADVWKLLDAKGTSMGNITVKGKRSFEAYRIDGLI